MNPGSEVERAIGQVVETILEEAGVERPPVDAGNVARRFGLEVRLDRSQRSRGRLVRRRRPTICVRPEPRHERSQWAIAHEIGEHFMPRIAEALDLDADALECRAREMLANRFAGLLLVPTNWLEFDSRLVGYDLFELKRLYATASYEVIAHRFLDLDPPTIVSVFDQGRLVRRSGNFAVGAPPLLAPEATGQRVSHRSGQAQHVTQSGISVQAWPIHEEGWKREILRAVFECEAALLP